jgi:hypothetical protein
MKHRRPSSAVVDLSCRVGPRSQDAVVVNVPASLHGTVMPLLSEPIDVPSGCGSASDECYAQRGLGIYSNTAILGISDDDPSLTSEISTSPLFWERLVAAVCECYRGARKRPQSERCG